jgi:NAD-dependent deacetylase
LKKILVFSGAGLDKESGVETLFRSGKEGLWNNFKIEEVASISGWHSNRKKVIDFYNLRRKEMDGVIPNNAHFLISQLEKNFDVTNATQNVSNLLEKAGSTNIIHLHGELSKLRSEINEDIKKPFTEDLKLGDLCPEGGQWRPDIIWFGEDLDLQKMEIVKQAAKEADVCIIVGTSMQVAPANGIPWMTKETAIIYYVDPSDINFYVPVYRRAFFYHIQKPASEGMKEVVKDLEEIYL